MDSTTRRELEVRRELLMSENRRVQSEINSATRVAIDHPDFSPRSKTVADRAVDALVSQQGHTIAQIQDIETQLER